MAYGSQTPRNNQRQVKNRLQRTRAILSKSYEINKTHRQTDNNEKKGKSMEQNELKASKPATCPVAHKGKSNVQRKAAGWQGHTNW